MLAAGCTHEAVAAELQRRFRLRPREALRHAHGWSVTETAQRFAHVAARTAGRRAGSPTVATEVGIHLEDYERWPTGGRQPSLYVLIVLAKVYGTTVHRLLDAEDWRALPPRDRVVATAMTPPDPPA
jgi:transcriptional regulator with XRE-family HTH domain